MKKDLTQETLLQAIKEDIKKAKDGNRVERLAMDYAQLDYMIKKVGWNSLSEELQADLYHLMMLRYKEMKSLDPAIEPGTLEDM